MGMNRIAMPRGRARRIVSWLAMLAIPMAFLEAIGFGTTRLAPEILNPALAKRAKVGSCRLPEGRPTRSTRLAVSFMGKRDAKVGAARGTGEGKMW